MGDRGKRWVTSVSATRLLVRKCDVLRDTMVWGDHRDGSVTVTTFLLALCMTSLIILLCMRCAAHLRVAYDVY